MSAEYAFGMARPPDESMPPDSPIYRSLGILRFYSARTCSSSHWPCSIGRIQFSCECEAPGTVLSWDAPPAKQPPDAAASYRHEQNRQCDCSRKHCNDCCKRKDVYDAILKCEKHAFPSAAKMRLLLVILPWKIALAYRIADGSGRVESVALPARGRACARSRPGGAGSGRGCCRRS